MGPTARGDDRCDIVRPDAYIEMLTVETPNRVS
jgi:hypothetical protein